MKHLSYPLDLLDKRNSPFSITNVKNNGTRKFGRVFKLIDESNGQILQTVKGTKAEAQNAAKELIVDGFRGKGRIVVTQEVTQGEPIVSYFEYTPSKSAKNGNLLVLRYYCIKKYNPTQKNKIN